MIAAVRDPQHPTAKELDQIKTGQDSSVIIVKYDAGNEQSAFEAVKELADNGIDHIDYVVANAGIAKQYPLVKDVKIQDLREHIEVNVFSVVSLYQATRPLLEKSVKKKPVYAIVGSGSGALGYDRHHRVYHEHG